MRRMSFAAVFAATLSVVSFSHAANTIQDFSATFPPGGGNASPIQPFGTVDIIDAWDGNALRLTKEENSLNNGFALPQLVSGAYDSLLIDFDFSISPGNGGGADGVGFVYANSNDFGATSGPFPAWGASEEPNLASSFGVGFDTFNNDADLGENTVSLHFDSEVVAEISMDDDFLPEEFLESGEILHAAIGITPSGAGSNVSVTLLNLDAGDSFIAFEDEFISGFTPYDGRVAFKGRTGGANSEQIVDNISLELTPQGGGAALTAMEDFSAYDEGDLEGPPPAPLPPVLGGTPFERTIAGTDPPATVVSVDGSEGAGPGYLRLSQNTGGQSNAVAFDQTSDVADNINAEFKFRINDSGNNADGMSFLLLGTEIYDESGPLESVPSEEPNLAGALGVGFDTFDNDEEGFFLEDGCGGDGTCPDNRANHISLHWDGAQVGDIQILEDFDLANSEWNTASLSVTPADGGMNVTLVIQDADGNGTVVFADEFVDGMEFPEGARAAFGARTGGASSDQLIDDVNISWTIGDTDPCDFNGDGSIDVADIDLLRSEIMAGSNASAFDINSDGSVNNTDLIALVEGPNKLNTYIGDANLDGEFNSSDFVSLFTAGQYDDGVAANSTWATGDFNSDGEFDSGDFVAAFTQGGYETGPRAATAAVPEPSSIMLLLVGGLMAIRRRR